MEIKEFFKNCTYCHNVWILVCSVDESGERQFDGHGIYYPEDLNDFIIDYGDEEINEWSVDNCNEYAAITFYLKS